MRQLLVFWWACVLFVSPCTAQISQPPANEKDSALLQKIRTKSKQWTVDENGNVTSIGTMLIFDGFDAILEFQNLKSVGIGHIESEWLEQLSKEFPNLESLTVDGCSNLKPGDLKIVEKFKSLLHFGISGEFEKPASLPKLPQILESLDLAKSNCFEPETTLDSVARLTNLESLRLPASWCGPPILKLMPLTKLTSLSAGGNKTESTHYLFQLLVDGQGRSANEAFKIVGALTGLSKTNGPRLFIGGNDLLVPYLNKIEDIDEMYLHTESYSRKGLDELEFPTGLVSLSLIGKASPDLLRKIAKSKTIQELSLIRCGSSDHLALLKDMSWLKSLDLSDTQEGSHELSLLSGLDELEYLILRRTSVQDADLASLASLKKLKKIDLKDSQTTFKARIKLYKDLGWNPQRSLESEGARFFQSEAGPRLHLGRQFIDEHCNLVAQMKEMSEIRITNADISDDGMHAISQLPVGRLSLYGCKNLTNKSLENIARNRNIKTLRIVGCHLITDEGLKSLEKMAWLESLSIRSKNVSDEAKESLKTKLPNCEIK